ncbi:RNA-splicing factor, variant 2 [Entomophthora muscae]|uniref:RNA-splicing factor, variant 2 n=1 Tax=Entomophthora muscae TaxID=34485 RepID=A0ACC2TA19_9FUNG|nr:RNA-splicing factor, variant 2 [Entomophthora muscae]
MQQLQEKAGLKKKSNQLDWMYTSGAGHTSGGLDEDKEAYLLGSKKVDKILAASAEQEAVFSLSSGSALDLSSANSLRDTQSKVREDPLLMIKKMEKASLDRYLNNPLKLNQLKEAKKPKKEKKSKKDKKSKREESDSEDDRLNYSRKYKEASPERNSRPSRDRRSFNDSRRDSLSPERARASVERSRYSYNQSRDDNRSSYHGSRQRSPHSSRKRSPSRPLSRRDYSPSSNRNTTNSSRDQKTREEEERKRKIQSMLNNATELESERKERIISSNRREEQEELEQVRMRSEVHHKGHVAKFQRDARHSAYSGAAADLGSRIQSQRAKLRLDD